MGLFSSIITLTGTGSCDTALHRILVIVTGHMMFIQCCINVDATSCHYMNVMCRDFS